MNYYYNRPSDIIIRDPTTRKRKRECDMETHIDFEAATAPVTFGLQIIWTPETETMSTLHSETDSTTFGVESLPSSPGIETDSIPSGLLTPTSSVNSDWGFEKLDLQFLPDEMEHITF